MTDDIYQIPAQQRIAVFVNSEKTVTIRQENVFDSAEDSMVVFLPEYAQILCRLIMEAASEAMQIK